MAKTDKTRLGYAVRITPFTDSEKRLIETAVSMKKHDFTFSGMPKLYHDTVLLGCKHLLLEERSSVQAEEIADGKVMRTAPFSHEERKLILSAVEKRKGEKTFKGMPLLYHDTILLGCKYIVLGDKTN